MKENGFTLIELLAVIVVLAIIALIATPIVLNIIKDSKESSMLRSADFYLDAVEFSIAERVLESKSIVDNTYEIMINGNICLGIIDKDTNICDDEMIVEVNGEVPKSGIITITSGKISDVGLEYNDKYITKDKKGNLVYGKKPSICALVEDGDVGEIGISVGDKYQCKVKEEMETEFENGYIFYVLSINENGTTNLILDRNVYYNSDNDTGFATETNKALIKWQASGKNADGPVAVMDYLYNATKDWNNVPNIVMDYEDEGNGGENGYGNIITKENITTITKKDATEVATYENLKARLPYESEVSDYTDESNNQYLYDNLHLDCYDNRTDLNKVSCDVAGYINGVNIEDISHINGIYGYWIFSSSKNSASAANGVYYIGKGPYTGEVAYTYRYGVRPVITLEL